MYFDLTYVNGSVMLHNMVLTMFQTVLLIVMGFID